MRFDVLTIFPEMFPGPLGIGVLGRALASGVVELHAHDLRSHAEGPHRQVDDNPFGGGPGMVLKPEPLVRAVRELRSTVPGIRTILLSPQGRRFDQSVARELACERAVLLVCGRYQGVDERAREEIGEELSVGDYILSGGEIAAMAVIEASGRLVHGVVGSPESLAEETAFEREEVLFEPPLYTRPALFENKEVPEVLRSGHHAAIETWRHDHARRQRRQNIDALLQSSGLPHQHFERLHQASSPPRRISEALHRHSVPLPKAFKPPGQSSAVRQDFPPRQDSHPRRSDSGLHEQFRPLPLGELLAPELLAAPVPEESA